MHIFLWKIFQEFSKFSYGDSNRILSIDCIKVSSKDRFSGISRIAQATHPEIIQNGSSKDSVSILAILLRIYAENLPKISVEIHKTKIFNYYSKNSSMQSSKYFPRYFFKSFYLHTLFHEFLIYFHEDLFGNGENIFPIISPKNHPIVPSIFFPNIPLCVSPRLLMRFSPEHLLRPFPIIPPNYVQKFFAESQAIFLRIIPEIPSWIFQNIPPETALTHRFGQKSFHLF